jgi:hypothetical protein
VGYAGLLVLEGYSAVTDDEIAEETIGENADVQKRNARVARTQKTLDEATTALMAHPQTRAWMYDLLSFCGMFKSSFDRSALSMAFNEGARNVGLRVTSDLMRVCPDGYTQMVREAEKENGR